jgi:hypothetical protein
VETVFLDGSPRESKDILAAPGWGFAASPW